VLFKHRHSAFGALRPGQRDESEDFYRSGLHQEGVTVTESSQPVNPSRSGLDAAYQAACRASRRSSRSPAAAATFSWPFWTARCLAWIRAALMTRRKSPYGNP
jgi:hypothetical protein